MSGKSQHEIPRLLQRGFLIRDPKTGERVYVYRVGGKIYPTNIINAAAERYFYSTPASDGCATLDDKITNYESPLASLVADLRRLPPGSVADPAAAATVVSHLTLRNAHLRGTIVRTLQKTADNIAETLGDQAKLAEIMGIDAEEPSEVFRSHLQLVHNLNQLALPDPFWEHAAFGLVKERYSQIKSDITQCHAQLVEYISQNGEKIVANAHNTALEQSFTADALKAKLSAFRWLVYEAKSDLILPDCVAFALYSEAVSHPLILADHSKIISVAMPLSSRVILVGAREISFSIDFDTVNQMAAACSLNYFICASRTPELEELVSLIGKRSEMILNDALRKL